ncbi:Uncharacterised protein [Vibrio cholerae]|nr:Uncharacterised protein [Vibrio cholerae]
MQHFTFSMTMLSMAHIGIANQTPILLPIFREHKARWRVGLINQIQHFRAITTDADMQGDRGEAIPVIHFHRFAIHPTPSNTVIVTVFATKCANKGHHVGLSCCYHTGKPFTKILFGFVVFPV